jgi:hypothetical protein
LWRRVDNVTRFELKVFAVMLDSSYTVRVDIFVLLLVFCDSVICPAPFPEPTDVNCVAFLYFEDE